MSPAPRFFHQALSMKLGTLLNNHVRSQRLGIVVAALTDVFLSDTDVYQPDILFVHSNRRDIIDDDGVHGAPDLVIEILSPSTSYYDEHRKKDIYQQRGVRELWIVDPMEMSIEAFTNSASGWETMFLGKEGTLCSSVLQEFCVDVKDVFSE